MLRTSLRPLTLTALLGSFALAVGCSSTKGSASTAPSTVEFVQPSDQLARQIQVKAVEAEFWRTPDDFVRLSDWFYNVGEPAYETLLDMAAGPSHKASELALGVIAVLADQRLAPRLRAEVPVPEEGSLRLDYGRALLYMGDSEGAGILIAGLEDPSPEKRALAYQALERATNNGIPFSPQASEEERAEQVAVWRRWFAAHSSDPMLQD